MRAVCRIVNANSPRPQKQGFTNSLLNGGSSHTSQFILADGYLEGRERIFVTPDFTATNGEFKAVRRGWYLGEAAFRMELPAQMGERLGAEHYGEERAETESAKAKRIIAQEWRRRKWTAPKLRSRPKGAAEKVALAARLRAETTMTTEWIAKRLDMGSRGYLNHLLYRRRNSRRE